VRPGPLGRCGIASCRCRPTGEIDIALVYRYANAPVEEEGFRLEHLGDDPIYLISQGPGDSLANHRHSAWIDGCDRCQNELTAACRHEGFIPRIASHSDDMVVVQSLVAAGIGVATLPGLALQAHRRPDIHATELTGRHRQIYAATYGDPPAATAVLAALTGATTPATSTETPSTTSRRNNQTKQEMISE
jgi:DNA-binding transcriptional LysR family regulator